MNLLPGSLRLLVLFLGLPGLLSSSLRGQTAPTIASGTIEGRLFNAGTSLTLSRARVVAEGTGHETVTDDYGADRLAVPAGEGEISVGFFGPWHAQATG